MIDEILDSALNTSVNTFLAIGIVYIIGKLFKDTFFPNELEVFVSRKGFETSEVPVEKLLTRQQLADYNGIDICKPILIGVDGAIYDVSKGRNFYGKDGPYHIFAGKDCTMAFAKDSFDESVFSLDPSEVHHLSTAESESLAEWKAKLNFKYTKVGSLINE